MNEAELEVLPFNSYVRSGILARRSEVAMPEINVACGYCNGTGGGWAKKCVICKGVGQLRVADSAVKCSHCSGTGKTAIGTCSVCHGAGWAVPPGIR